MIWLLGMITRLLSPVFNTVVRICTSSTEPETPPPSIQSPTLYGRNSTISTPAAKFDSEPCNARPTARPAAPIRATSEAVLTPRAPMAAMMTNSISSMRARFATKRRRVVSTSLFCMAVSMPFTTRFTTHLPTKKMTIAVIRLIPKSTPVVCIIVQTSAQSKPRSGRLSVFIDFPLLLLFVFLLAYEQPVACEGE